MTAFDAYDLIALWERNQGLSVAEKALLLLALARPGVSRQELGAMPVGERDRVLFEMRRALFGDRLEGLAVCPACDERLEMEFPISEFLANAMPTAPEDHASITVDDIEVSFRLPTTDDAVVVACSGHDGDARPTLVRRCIVSAARDGASVDTGDLDLEVFTRVSATMETLDPFSEIRLNMTCSACDHAHSVLMEIASYLWQELVHEAERLLDEVRMLARDYGWREADILAMSGRRRQFYLEQR